MFFLEPTNKPSYFLLDPKTKGEGGSLFMREHSKYQSLQQSRSTRVLCYSWEDHPNLVSNRFSQPGDAS